MDGLLINAQEIVQIAFDPIEQISPQLIKESHIKSAQLRFIKPVLGNLYPKLFEDQLNVQYSKLIEQYLKEPLAFFVKYMAINDLNTRSGALGISTFKNNFHTQSTKLQIALLRKDTLNTANNLLDAAIEYIESNPDLFKDYEAYQNARNRVSIAGGIVNIK